MKVALSSAGVRIEVEAEVVSAETIVLIQDSLDKLIASLHQVPIASVKLRGPYVLSLINRTPPEFK